MSAFPDEFPDTAVLKDLTPAQIEHLDLGLGLNFGASLIRENPHDLISFILQTEGGVKIVFGRDCTVMDVWKIAAGTMEE